MYMTEGDCYGKEWDMRDNRCAMCMDNELCGIVSAAAIRDKVKEIEKIEKYLDLSRMDQVKEDEVRIWLALKPRTVPELVAKVKDIGKTTDDVAVVEWIKRFVKGDPDVYIKDSVVYTR